LIRRGWKRQPSHREKIFRFGHRADTVELSNIDASRTFLQLEDLFERRPRSGIAIVDGWHQPRGGSGFHDS
jgi:hypothetical protein